MSVCKHTSRLGPDLTDVIMCTWQNIAIPAILFGTEFTIFKETNLLEIERVQAQVAKYALSIPKKSPNIVAQSELGMKTFRHCLYEKQLKFYSRVLFMDKRYWVHQALLDHLDGSWESPYLEYISNLRHMFQIYSLAPGNKEWQVKMSSSFLNNINESILTLPGSMPIKSFEKAAYVCENENSTVIAEFKLGFAGLGNKIPRPGYTVKPFCPLCPIQHSNNEFHLLFICNSVSRTRSETGLSLYLTTSLIKGLSINEAYKYYICGLDVNGARLSKSDYLQRGKCMATIRKKWLDLW